jgi:hypothetical protein
LGKQHHPSSNQMPKQNMKTLIVLTIILTGTTLLGEPAPEEKLAAFIQLPPPIREMAVECNWYAHGIGKTNTKWVILCWQTNAYIVRSAKQRVGLYETFDTNRDDLITIRAGDTYSTVSWYKNLGTHTRQVEGIGDARISSSEKPLASTWERDRVTPMIRGQEVLAAHALTLGIPVPVGAIAITNGAFTYRDEAEGRTLSGVIEVSRDDVVTGFSMTDVVDRTTERERVVVPGTIRYEYGGTTQPAWFPHVIERDAVIRGKRLTMCRFVIHRMDLGDVPRSQFEPDRFLKQ